MKYSSLSVRLGAAPSLVCACCLFLGACGSNEGTVAGVPASDSATNAPVQAWPATRSTDRGGYAVTLAPEGGAIARNQHFALEVTLTSQDGAPGDVGVVVDADMPAHQHGMNTKPEISPLGPARYRVEGMLFHMSGDWVITVDINRGTDTYRATFPVSVE